MPSKKSTYKHTLELIAFILSVENTSNCLENHLHSNLIDWDQFVVVASEHLVLTTAYCKLKQSEVLHLIPEDLNTYLETLTSVNRNRNLTLINEIKDISDLLNNQNINHVFIKGAAMLIGDFYVDIGERMIGDIDILVDSNQAEDAFKLLQNQGYSSLVEFNYDDATFRHLSRQNHSEKMASIELHDSILNKNHKGIIDEHNILLTKKMIHGMSIPNQLYLNLINIAASQFNNDAFRYKRWSLRNLYDSLVLNLADETDILNQKDPYIIDYLSKLKAVFKQIPIDQTHYSQKQLKAYQSRLKQHKLYRFLNKTKYLYFSILKRIRLLVSNKSYRQHILNNKFLKKR